MMNYGISATTTTKGNQYIIPFANINYRKNFGKSCPRTDLIELNRINNQLVFKTPKTYKYAREDGYLSLSINNLNVEIMEDNYSKLKESLIEEFEFLWDTYAKERDNNLTGGAKKIKYWLLKNIEEKR